MAETVFETRVVPVWHILIFGILCFYMVIGVFAIVKGIPLWPIMFIFFGPLFFLFLYSILFSELKVYEDGITFRMYHVYFDEMGRIRLKWGGRLLIFAKLPPMRARPFATRTPWLNTPSKHKSKLT